jgi:hypothetical protein
LATSATHFRSWRKEARRFVSTATPPSTPRINSTYSTTATMGWTRVGVGRGRNDHATHRGGGGAEGAGTSHKSSASDNPSAHATPPHPTPRTGIVLRAHRVDAELASKQLHRGLNGGHLLKAAVDRVRGGGWGPPRRGHACSLWELELGIPRGLQWWWWVGGGAGHRSGRQHEESSTPSRRPRQCATPATVTYALGRTHTPAEAHKPTVRHI